MYMRSNVFAYETSSVEHRPLNIFILRPVITTDLLHMLDAEYVYN